MTANSGSQTQQSEDPKQLFRSKVDRIFAGVCGGFAEYFNIDVMIVRIIMLVLFFFKGIGILLYLICLIVMKENPEQTADQKKPQNTSIFWGIGLVLLGLSLLSPHWHWNFWAFNPFHMYWFDFWPFDWDQFWPVVIILLGVLYLLYVIRQNKAREAGEEPTPKIFRSRTDKIIGGVCGGLAQNLKVDPVLIRIGWVLLSLITKVFLGVVVYILWMIIIPEKSVIPETPVEEKTPEEKPKAKTPKRVKKLPKKDEPEQSEEK